MVLYFLKLFLHFSCFYIISYNHLHNERIYVLCVLVLYLVHSFSIMLLSSELNGPPWSTPTFVLLNIWFSITSAFRYLCINEITLPSFMVLDKTLKNLLWNTVSKNSSKSISTTYTYPAFTFLWHCLNASWAPLFDRKSKLLLENCSSNMGGNCLLYHSINCCCDS